MGLDIILATAGLIILIGYLTDIFFSKTNIPDVIWLILIGIFLGPFMQLVTTESLGDAAQIFTTFALIFILFEGGLHIRVKDLMKSMYGATSISIVNFVITSVVIMFIGRFLGYSYGVSILLGTILGGTSSAVVVPIVRKLKMGSDNSLVLILESAFTDVLCIVSTLTIVSILKLNNVDFGGILNALFGSFAIAIFVGAILGFVWVLLLEKYNSLSKSYISTIGALLIVYGITEFSRSSGAIAALAFGIVMGNSRKILSLAEGEQETDPLTATARNFFSQISFFVKTFFFVYIGVLTSLTDIQPLLIGLIISIAIILIRPISVLTAYKGTDPKERSIMEVMVPRGLAAAVLAQVPFQAGIIGAEQILTPVFSTIFITITLTTIMVFLIQHDKYPGTGNLVRRAIYQVFPQKVVPVPAKAAKVQAKKPAKKEQPLK